MNIHCNIASAKIISCSAAYLNLDKKFEEPVNLSISSEIL